MDPQLQGGIPMENSVHQELNLDCPFSEFCSIQVRVVSVNRFNLSALPVSENDIAGLLIAL